MAATSEIQLNTPLAESIQNAVLPKLAELGWVSGGADDTALAEYIVLMLVNGKTQEEIAAELANDLLNVGPEDSGAVDFSRWLFQQVEAFSGGASQGEVVQSIEPANGGGSTAMDAEMDEAADDHQDGTVPTGPKSMRGLPSKPRDKRIIGQLNKAMDRSSDNTLRRIKGTAGTGRINSHSNEPPKGPRRQTGRPGLGGPRAPTHPMGMPQMPQNGAAPFGNMSPQQQMQLLAMYEEQARMMAQIFSPQQAQQMFPGNVNVPNGFGSQQQNRQGKSLFERVDKPRRRQNHQQSSNSIQDATSSMEVEPTSSQQSTTAPKDLSTTPCRFNAHCTSPTCPYAHSSPAAPPGAPPPPLDTGDKCSYGAACKNKKCTASHPSPATRSVHQSETPCKFYPHCTNPACPFLHTDTNQNNSTETTINDNSTAPANALSTAPPLGSAPRSAGSGVAAIPCRNGPDCRVPHCAFAHVAVPCRFNPCLNPACTFKHAAGQQRGRFTDRVWTAAGAAAAASGTTTTGAGGDGEAGGSEDAAMHVSERRFVDADDGEEELILPGRGGDGMEPAGLVT